jgi:hypothetical protein
MRALSVLDVFGDELRNPSRMGSHHEMAGSCDGHKRCIWHGVPEKFGAPRQSGMSIPAAKYEGCNGDPRVPDLRRGHRAPPIKNVGCRGQHDIVAHTLRKRIEASASAEEVEHAPRRLLARRP